MVPALTNCNHLEVLDLWDNPTVTTRGWQSLATILEAPNSNLEVLDMLQNNIDDEAVASFANALTNNNKLHTMHLGSNTPIRAVGLQAFSNVLCDTTSVNATFLSNHTLRHVGNVEEDASRVILPLLDLNERDDKKEVATIKILQNHDDFDMLPFFEWEFKVLPLVVNWLERASSYEMPDDFEPNIERRKLSTIYQFVRGMPLLYVDTRLRKELEDIKAKKKQLEEEQLKLHRELQLLEERSRSIMKRLGKK